MKRIFRRNPASRSCPVFLPAKLLSISPRTHASLPTPVDQRSAVMCLSTCYKNCILAPPSAPLAQAPDRGPATGRGRTVLAALAPKCSARVPYAGRVAYQNSGHCIPKLVPGGHSNTVLASNVGHGRAVCSPFGGALQCAVQPTFPGSAGERTSGIQDPVQCP